LADGGTENGTSDTDLYIWDFEPERAVPPGLRQESCKHLFLVNRKDVATFHTCLGRADANILLKPVTRTTLSAFLGLAVSAHAERLSAANGMRAERDEILQCLIQTNLKLQEFDQDRTNFLARALHDFRAPLTAISGYCDLLVNEALGPLQENQKDVLRKMNRSTERLSRMVSAMFQLSVGRQVNMRPDSREGDIRECVEQALHEVYSIAAGKDISITTDLDPAIGLLFFEPGQIEQVLINLLDNACKFTPKAGLIEIMGYPFFWDRRMTASSMPFAGERRRQNSQKPNAYRIDILNSGLPIPDEHLGDIFEEFTSYSGGQDRSGGGLGLAICRMIITRHDGRMWAENRANGPSFSFVLPVRTTKMPGG
jgi:signal transduction histidine kinase